MQREADPVFPDAARCWPPFVNSSASHVSKSGRTNHHAAPVEYRSNQSSCCRHWPDAAPLLPARFARRRSSTSAGTGPDAEVLSAGTGPTQNEVPPLPALALTQRFYHWPDAEAIVGGRSTSVDARPRSRTITRISQPLLSSRGAASRRGSPHPLASSPPRSGNARQR